MAITSLIRPDEEDKRLFKEATSYANETDALEAQLDYHSESYHTKQMKSSEWIKAHKELIAFHSNYYNITGRVYIPKHMQRIG